MDEPNAESKGGILLPESAREDRVPGEVLAIGPGRPTEHGAVIKVDDIEISDRVIFNKFTAYELDEDERLYIVRGHDITCKVSE